MYPSHTKFWTKLEKSQFHGSDFNYSRILYFLVDYYDCLIASQLPYIIYRGP